MSGKVASENIPGRHGLNPSADAFTLARATRNELETRSLGNDLAVMLGPGDVVALIGDLGSGKTVLVRGICAAFGCAEQVTSPSFTLINEYAGTVKIMHCDLYRLTATDQLSAIGFNDLFSDDCVVLIEWAERAGPLLPYPRYEIVCEHGDSRDERVFRAAFVESRSDSILPAT